MLWFGTAVTRDIRPRSAAVFKLVQGVSHAVARAATLHPYYDTD